MNQHKPILYYYFLFVFICISAPQALIAQAPRSDLLEEILIVHNANAASSICSAITPILSAYKDLQARVTSGSLCSTDEFEQEVAALRREYKKRIAKCSAQRTEIAHSLYDMIGERFAMCWGSYDEKDKKLYQILKDDFYAECGKQFAEHTQLLTATLPEDLDLFITQRAARSVSLPKIMQPLCTKAGNNLVINGSAAAINHIMRALNTSYVGMLTGSLPMLNETQMHQLHAPARLAAMVHKIEKKQIAAREKSYELQRAQCCMETIRTTYTGAINDLESSASITTILSSVAKQTTHRAAKEDAVYAQESLGNFLTKQILLQQSEVALAGACTVHDFLLAAASSKFVDSQSCNHILLSTFYRQRLDTLEWFMEYLYFSGKSIQYLIDTKYPAIDKRSSSDLTPDIHALKKLRTELTQEFLAKLDTQLDEIKRLREQASKTITTAVDSIDCRLMQRCITRTNIFHQHAADARTYLYKLLERLKPYIDQKDTTAPLQEASEETESPASDVYAVVIEL